MSQLFAVRFPRGVNCENEIECKKMEMKGGWKGLELMKEEIWEDESIFEKNIYIYM